MKRMLSFCLVWLATGAATAAAQAGGGAQSPASRRPPQTVSPQSYPPEMIATGRARFVSQCGFCHGRDAAGGETGPDLTRSALVAEDSRGDKIGPLVRAGRADKGMPPFDLNDSDIAGIVAYIHDQKTKAESLGGGRRAVDETDLQTGNVEAGRRYFSGSCSTCHSATGDLAGVAKRFSGLTLLQRMLYPPGVRPATTPAKVTVTLPSGETVTGPLASRDEFSIALKAADGSTRTWAVTEVKFTVDDPMSAHFDLLGKYSDDDMHNIYAYLQTLQ